MASDPFDGLLDLEQNFYQDGYDAGIADGEHAGLVEGKVFGIEKGYEKALELSRLRGRALVWQSRSQQPTTPMGKEVSAAHISSLLQGSSLSKNSRLTKHIESLLSVTEESSVAPDNSDASVTEFDDRIAKARAKAKVIAAIIAEPLDSDLSTGKNAGIEDAKGLNARH